MDTLFFYYSKYHIFVICFYMNNVNAGFEIMQIQLYEFLLIDWSIQLLLISAHQVKPLLHKDS